VSRGLVQPFYWRARERGEGREEVELGTAQQREARPGQGRSKGAVSLVRHDSAIRKRRPRGARASGMGRFGAGEGDLAAVLSRHCFLARLAGRHRKAGRRRPLPLDGTEQGREREESEGRERKSEGPGSNEFFSKVCKETLKSANTKVVGNLKLCDFCFGSKFI
jgi:hypothetical protein